MSHGFSFPNYGLFNATYYLQQNPDVATSWTGTPLQHYQQYGALEGRAPTAWFNADFYRASYPDLQSMNALQLFNHYCNYGFNEGRVPMLNFSNFNGVRYLLDNPDVAAAGYTAADAVSHYVVYGEYEGRAAYANNGVVIDPVVNEGELFTLTTGVDSIQGTQFNDTFDASQEGTLQNFDSLDGMGGTDTLYATLGYYNSSVTPMQLSNIEIISATANQNSTNATLNLINAGQVTNVNNNASTENLTVTNIAAGADLAVSNTTFATRFDYASTTGTQSVDLAISEVTSNADITIAGVETINITSSGNLANVVDLIATSATTITAAGTAALDIVPNAAADLGAATLIDGTNMSGALTATLSIAGTINGGLGNDALTGSSGNDVISGNAGNDVLGTGAGGKDSVSGGLGDDTINTYVSTTGYLTADDTIDGGVGTNTLGVVTADVEGLTTTTAFTKISNIQTLNATTAGTSGATLDVVKVASSINQVNLAAGTLGSYTVNMNAAASTLQLGAATGSTLLTVAETGGTGTSDSLSIVNTNVTAGIDVFAGAVTTTGFETVSINTGSVATATQAISTLTINGETAASTPVTLNVSGINTLDLSTALATSNAGLTTVNASGLTGAAILDIAAFSGVTGSTLSITGSAGNDVLGTDASTDVVLSNYATTIDAGAGADWVYTGSAADSIHGGAGNDTLNSGTGNDTVRGGDGQDLITVSTGAVSVDGGADNDTINIGNTLNTGDVLDGGSGVDTLAMSAALISPYANVTNFETLQLNNPGNQVGSNPGSFTQNLAFFTGTAFSTVELTSYQTVYNVSGLADAATVLISRNVGTPSSNERANNPTVLTHATDTANNTLSLGWYRDTTNANAAVGIVTVNDTNTLNFVQGQMDAAHTIEYAINAVQVTQINLTGDAGQIFSVRPHASSVTGFGDTARAITIDGSANTGLVIVDASTAIAGQNLTMMGSVTAVNTLTGGAGNDVITGGAAADSLVGGAGNDTVSGGAGNDSITGGDGADTINFGAGTDTAVYTAAGQTATDLVASGVTVLTGVDTIANAGAGDVIDGNVDFSGTVGTSLITTGSQTAGTVAVVLGNYNVLTGIFTTSTTGADTLVQYCAGTADADIQDIVLVGYATAGAASINGTSHNLVIG